MSILFNKTRSVKSPNRAYDTSDAVDFFIPEYDSDFLSDLKSKNPNKEFYECSVSPNCDSMTISLAPHGRINIPSGIRVIINNEDTCLLAVNKSGVATKLGLTICACLIDRNYTGEIHLSVINTGSEPVQIKTGEKLVQFMHIPVIHSVFQEILSEDFDKLKPNSDRGSGGFGSSGNF